MLFVNKVVVTYDFPVLRKVSINVKKGEIVTVIGSNNAGKSTLLKSIVGLVPVDSGSIQFADKKIDNLRAYERARLGISYSQEGGQIFNSLTVGENLKTASSFSRAKKKRTESLELVSNLFPILKKREHQLAETLSGGERQMLSIGSSLMARPRLLLLDEPSFGLAPQLADAVFKIINDLQDKGITILLVEQNVPRGLKIADKAYLLEKGRVTLEGDPNELLRDPHIKEAYLA